MPDYPSDHVLLGDAKEYVIQMLCKRGVSPELLRAWEVFYQRYDSLIRRFAVNCGIPRRDLEDAVQTAWAAVIEGLPSFECDPRRGSFRAWLFARVRNVVVDQFRRAARCLERAAGVDFENLPGKEPEPDVVFEMQWNEVVLQEALTKLQQYVSEEHYRLFIMRHLYELSIAELVEDCGLSEDTVRQRLHRTTEIFAQVVANHGYRDRIFVPRE